MNHRTQKIDRNLSLHTTERAQDIGIFRSVIDGLLLAVNVVDMETCRILFMNQYAKRIYGDRKGEICWKTFQMNQTGPCADCNNGRLIGMRGESGVPLVWSGYNSVAGTWWEMHDQVISWTDGRKVKLQIAHAISGPRQMDEESFAGEGGSGRLFNDSPAGIFEIDLKRGRFIAVNDIITTFSGYSREELLGMDIQELLMGDGRAKWMEGLGALDEKGGTVTPEEYWFACKEGGRFRGLLSAQCFCENGIPVRAIGVVQDITPLKRRENLRLTNQKMESLSTLAGGIAHQFNNGLTAISWRGTLLENECNGNGRITQHIAAIERSIQKMAGLTTQLLLYAGGGDYAPACVSPCSVVSNSLRQIQQGLGAHIHVEADLAQDAFPVRVGSRQLQVILAALVDNAREAIKGPGRIRISFQNRYLDPGFVKDHPEFEPGPYVCLTVEDNGKGMDEETQEKIFDPFFTSHFLGRGLGLAAVYGIVKNHSGEIQIESALGEGTIVRIFLPAA